MNGNEKKKETEVAFSGVLFLSCHFLCFCFLSFFPSIVFNY